MELAASLFIATSLAMDAFAVSLGIGTTRRAEDLRSRFRLSFHFGLFQSLMTILGWMMGSSVARYIAAFDHWVAFGLLAYVGGNMLRSGMSSKSEENTPNPSRGKTLILLCIATSLDAMAVGLGMAIIRAPIVQPAILIGVVTLGLSAFGLGIGGRLGEKFGKRMEIVGGLILIAIGLNILVTHLIAG